MELPTRDVQAKLDGNGRGPGKLSADLLAKLPHLQQQLHPQQQQQLHPTQQQQQRIQQHPYSDMPLGARAPGSSSPTPAPGGVAAPPPPAAGTLPALPPQQPPQDLQLAWRQLMMYAQAYQPDGSSGMNPGPADPNPMGCLPGGPLPGLPAPNPSGMGAPPATDRRPSPPDSGVMDDLFAPCLSPSFPLGSDSMPQPPETLTDAKGGPNTAETQLRVWQSQVPPTNLPGPTGPSTAAGGSGNSTQPDACAWRTVEGCDASGDGNNRGGSGTNRSGGGGIARNGVGSGTYAGVSSCAGGDVAFEGGAGGGGAGGGAAAADGVALQAGEGGGGYGIGNGGKYGSALEQAGVSGIGLGEAEYAGGDGSGSGVGGGDDGNVSGSALGGGSGNGSTLDQAMPPGMMFGSGFPNMMGGPGGSPGSMFGGASPNIFESSLGGGQAGAGLPAMPDAAVLMGMMMAMRAVGEAGLLPPPYAQMYEQAQQAMKRQQEQQQQQQSQEGQQHQQQQQQQQPGRRPSLPPSNPSRQQQPPPMQSLYPPYPHLHEPHLPKGPSAQVPPSQSRHQVSYYDPPPPGAFGTPAPFDQPHLFDQLLTREQMHYQRQCAQQAGAGQAEGSGSLEGSLAPIPNSLWGSMGEGVGAPDSSGGGTNGSSGIGTGLGMPAWNMGMDGSKLSEDYVMRTAAMSEGGLSMSLSPGLESPTDSLPAISSSQPIFGSASASAYLPPFMASSRGGPTNNMQQLQPPPQLGSTAALQPPLQSQSIAQARMQRQQAVPGTPGVLGMPGAPPLQQLQHQQQGASAARDKAETAGSLPFLPPGLNPLQHQHQQQQQSTGPIAALARAGSTGSWLGDILPTEPAIHSPNQPPIGAVVTNTPHPDPVSALPGMPSQPPRLPSQPPLPTPTHPTPHLTGRLPGPDPHAPPIMPLTTNSSCKGNLFGGSVNLTAPRPPAPRVSSNSGGTSDGMHLPGTGSDNGLAGARCLRGPTLELQRQGMGSSANGSNGAASTRTSPPLLPTPSTNPPTLGHAILAPPPPGGAFLPNTPGYGMHPAHPNHPNHPQLQQQLQPPIPMNPAASISRYNSTHGSACSGASAIQQSGGSSFCAAGPQGGNFKMPLNGPNAAGAGAGAPPLPHGMNGTSSMGGGGNGGGFGPSASSGMGGRGNMFGSPLPQAPMWCSVPPWCGAPPPMLGGMPGFGGMSLPMGSAPLMPGMPDLPPGMPPSLQKGPPRAESLQPQPHAPAPPPEPRKRGSTTGASRAPRTAGKRAPRPPPAHQEKADALLDEKQLKRKQSNRDSARRSRLRKQAENADFAENMDNLTVQNKELGCRAAQLRATASALEAANAAMKSFLATAQAHRANNPAASSFEGSSAAAAAGLSGADAAAHHAQLSHAIGSEVSALRTQLSALEATRVEVVAQEAANTRAAVIAVQAAAARAACGSSSHATSHDEHDDESHEGLPTPRVKRMNRGGCAWAPPPLGSAVSGVDSQELLTLSKEANTASSREQLDEPSS